MAGLYPCNGYDRLSKMTVSAFHLDNANDSWGWTDPETVSAYALIGLGDGPAFLNIDDPIFPAHSSFEARSITFTT
jgi:hypothetical protein